MLVYSDLCPKTAASKNITTPILKYARSIFLSGSRRRKKKKNTEGTRGSRLQELNGWFPDVVASMPSS